ncbi:MAG: LPS-assembly protein LptD [Succinivibrionaceae bacterium]
MQKYAHVFILASISISTSYINTSYGAPSSSNSVSATTVKNIYQLGYDSRCNVNIPPHNPNAPEYNLNQTPVSIESDEVAATLHTVEYKGNVEIKQGNKTLRADSTKFNQNTQEMEAQGGVFYQDNEITVESDTTLKTNLDTNTTELNEAKYFINGTLVRGSADYAHLDNVNKTVSLEGASISTCPENAETWHITSTSLNVDQNEIFGESWNTVLWIKSIPIAYIPYINFPIKNVRKTGFLYPNLGYGSTDGYRIGVPIYFNLAPNYDATLTPNAIQHRGLYTQAEIRYLLLDNFYGKFIGEYNHKDKLLEKENTNKKLEDKYKRWLFHWYNNAFWMNKDLQLEIDYNKIRDYDYNYFNDYDSSVDALIDNQIKQSLSLTYDKKNFDASIQLLRHQVLVPIYALYGYPYQLLPKININYRNFISNILSYRIYGEYANFRAGKEVADFVYEGERFHLQPEIELPILDAYGLSINTLGRMFLTHYKQNIPSKMPTSKGFSKDSMDESVNRYLYEFEANGKMVFVNNLDNGYNLTFEPEIQYMYVPYKNQDSIGIYDSTDRLYDYHSVFSYKKYIGNDRISDINRISYGFTYRVYDEAYKERLRFNIGQAYDFVPQRVKLYPNDSTNYYPRTPISSSININLIDWLSTHAEIVYDTKEKETSTWNTQLIVNYEDYKGQISYRYSRDGNRTLKNEIIDVKQLGGSLVLPLTDDFKVVGAMYYDLEQSQNIDQKLAIKYESCCYTFGAQIERYQKPDNITLTAEDEKKYGIFLELKGLGGTGINTTFDESTKLIPYNDLVNLSK